MTRGNLETLDMRDPKSQFNREVQYTIRRDLSEEKLNEMQNKNSYSQIVSPTMMISNQKPAQQQQIRTAYGFNFRQPFLNSGNISTYSNNNNQQTESNGFRIPVTSHTTCAQNRKQHMKKYSKEPITTKKLSWSVSTGFVQKVNLEVNLGQKAGKSINLANRFNKNHSLKKKSKILLKKASEND